MMETMNGLTDQSILDGKVFNKKLVGKWRAEILTPNEDVSENIIDWVRSHDHMRCYKFIL